MVGDKGADWQGCSPPLPPTLKMGRFKDQEALDYGFFNFQSSPPNQPRV